MPGVDRGKKLVRVPEDLVDRLEEEADRQGKSFYRYLTEVLEQAVRSRDMGPELKDILDQYELLDFHREAGSVLTPRDVLDYLVDKNSRDDEALQKMLYQNGRWYGICLKRRLGNGVGAFARLLRDGLWGVDGVKVEDEREFIHVRCVSTSLSSGRTLLLQKFMEGTLHSLGYKILEQECFTGIISIKFALPEMD